MPYRLFFCILILYSIKIRTHCHSGFTSMHKKGSSLSIKLILYIACIFLFPPSLTQPKVWAIEKVSFKASPSSGIIVPNPMEIAKLPLKKTYQVNHEAFTLQFFFNEKDIFGIILKRDKRRPIHFRWCFFRSCEESPRDYKKVIAETYGPPFNDGFFSIPNPFYLNYSFQGIEFSSPD